MQFSMHSVWLKDIKHGAGRGFVPIQDSVFIAIYLGG
jgi:hypothetical protein